MAVSKQLGHSTPTVTLNVYAHLFEDDLDRLYAGLDHVDRGPERSCQVPERSRRGPGTADDMGQPRAPAPETASDLGEVQCAVSVLLTGQYSNEGAASTASRT